MPYQPQNLAWGLNDPKIQSAEGNEPEAILQDNMSWEQLSSPRWLEIYQCHAGQELNL